MPKIPSRRLFWSLISSESLLTERIWWYSRFYKVNTSFCFALGWTSPFQWWTRRLAWALLFFTHSPWYIYTRIEEHAPSYFLFKIIFRYCTRDVSHWLSCTPTTSKIISKIKNKVDILNFYLNQWFRKEEDTCYVLLTWFIERREWFFYVFVFYVPWFSQSPSRVRKFGHTRPGSKSLLPALYKHPVYELRWSFSAQTPLSVSHLGFLASLLCHTRMAYENLTTKQTAK